MVSLVTGRCADAHQASQLGVCRDPRAGGHLAGGASTADSRGDRAPELAPTGEPKHDTCRLFHKAAPAATGNTIPPPGPLKSLLVPEHETTSPAVL